MKAKSSKFRTLITLHTLYKNSDEKHCINSVNLNEYLKPYKLECSDRVLRNTVKTLREYGVDIRGKGGKRSGVWLGSHPLPPPNLNRIIFAITTNPHITKEQATEILSYLKPLVTIYQEDALVAITDTSPDLKADDTLYEVYCTICKAIQSHRRVRFFTEHMRYRKETHTLATKISKGVLFTPKWIYQSYGNIYMVGYNNSRERPQAVNLKSIIDIKIAPKLQKEITEESLNLLSAPDPKFYIPEEKEIELYRGEVTFFCKDRYIEELYNRFGAPSKPVAVNSRHKATYTVSDAVITTKTLFWMSGIDDYGVRIKGPNKLTKAVKEYYQTLSSLITKAVIVSSS